MTTGCSRTKWSTFHFWIEEGIAVYVEPIARIQAGQMTASRMWSDLMRDMPKGVPEPDSKGLDHTHSWANTYWGGALYCFLADVEIRKETHNKKGLQDALRGILNAGGDIRQDWKLEDVLKTGDQVTGTSVMAALYAKMKDQPMDVDLPGLWKQLGIEADGKTVRLVDDAPLAAIRRAITDAATAKTAQPNAEGAQPLAVFAGRAAGFSPQRFGER
jgi:predicted metalloprotease with PDZ domain